MPAGRNYACAMARHIHLVAWDVCCPARLARVGHVVKAWRASGQRSVAECLMSRAERDMLAATLADTIDPAADRLHLFRLDPRLPARLFGIARSQGDKPFIMS